eukprot:41012-Chlamydomonas_euryale.AAC.1
MGGHKSSRDTPRRGDEHRRSKCGEQGVGGRSTGWGCRQSAERGSIGDAGITAGRLHLNRPDDYGDTT